jgi:osmotically-inducible protein OsmY
MSLRPTILAGGIRIRTSIIFTRITSNITGYDLDEDTVIAESIKDQKWWNPFVDADEFFVTVKDGITTITGVVDSRSEHQAATENAYDDGALSIENDTKVF